MTLARRRQMLALSGRSGNLWDLEDAAGCRPAESAFAAAAAQGNHDICEWLAERYCPDCGEAVEAAAAGRHLDSGTDLC